MNADGKSDESVVPLTRTNNSGTEPVAESVEGRNSAKRNTEQPDHGRTVKRNHRGSSGLHGVREAARAKPELKFTSLLHHINEALLYEAFFDLKKTAAVGIDEVTWHDYEQDLENHIPDLHGRPVIIEHGPRSLPGEAIEENLHRQSRWSATTDRNRIAGGQTCPESGRVGVAEYL